MRRASTINLGLVFRGNPAHRRLTVDAKVKSECAPTNSSLTATAFHFSKPNDYLALPLVPLYPIVGNGETDIDSVEPNDGLVAISSAQWGTFRGCIPADHMEQLGQYNLPDVNVRTGVDMAWFYASVASDLAGQGVLMRTFVLLVHRIVLSRSRSPRGRR